MTPGRIRGLRIPLFRTVGIDHTFYGPPTAKMLAHYAAQLHRGFQACAKVWEEITVPVFTSGLRYTKKALGLGRSRGGRSNVLQMMESA